ncbi:hypothetical protein E4U19_004834 [Claviceps sp. Clav32 group G5]|nr:hypothetical protein E4U19_004834 [Claviceps sp. Clav32 group G5]KAG6046096.1 hypothetical protein E4U39_001651 [Claviceps sp. Clav50 group G5]
MSLNLDSSQSLQKTTINPSHPIIDKFHQAASQADNRESHYPHQAFKSNPTNQAKMNRCLLRDREDWRTWINTFSARAVSSDTWEKLDPDHPVPLRVKPTRPQLPDPSKYHGAFSNQSRPSELSNQGYEAYERDLLVYDMLLIHYSSDLEAYEREQKKIRELTALLQSTVSLYLQRKCCLPDRPLQEWLSSLKVELGVDDCENQPPQASQQ